jgi:hypothetical protein
MRWLRRGWWPPNSVALEPAPDDATGKREVGGGPNKFISPPPCGGELRGAARRRHLAELRKNNRPTKCPNFSTPRAPMVRAAAVAAVVKNVMKPREGEDVYESHPQRAMAMPPQRSSRMRSDSRAGGHRERRSSSPSGRANELPREEWGARRPHTWRRRAEATQPWRGQELLLWCTGKSRT